MQFTFLNWYARNISFIWESIAVETAFVGDLLQAIRGNAKLVPLLVSVEYLEIVQVESGSSIKLM